METRKIQELSYEMVDKILSENNVDLKAAQKDVLYSVCSNAIVMGYQLALAENISFITKKLNEIKGEEDVKSQC